MSPIKVKLPTRCFKFYFKFKTRLTITGVTYGTIYIIYISSSSSEFSHPLLSVSLLIYLRTILSGRGPFASRSFWVTLTISSVHLALCRPMFLVLSLHFSALTVIGSATYVNRPSPLSLCNNTSHVR